MATIPADHRFTQGGDEFDLVVAFSATDVGTGTGPVKLSALPAVPVQNITSMNLIESCIRGIPVTGTRSDYPYYIWSFQGIPGPSTIGTNNALIDGFVTLCKAQDVHTVYTDRVIGRWQSPMTIRKITMTVQYPDGSPVKKDDLLDATFVFRCYRDYRVIEASKRHARK